MRASGFKVVGCLEKAGEEEISWEDVERERREGGSRQLVKTVEAEEPDYEVELMPRAVVDTCAVAKRREDISGDFVDGSRICEAKASVEFGHLCSEFVKEVAEGGIAEARALLIDGRMGLDDGLN